MIILLSSKSKQFNITANALIKQQIYFINNARPAYYTELSSHQFEQDKQLANLPISIVNDEYGSIKDSILQSNMKEAKEKLK